MTRDEWEAQTRDSAEYRRAASVLDMLSDFRRKVAELERSPALSTDAGQLAKLDRMAAQLDRMAD